MGNGRKCLFCSEAGYRLHLLTDSESLLIKLKINKRKVYGCDPYSKENDERNK